MQPTIGRIVLFTFGEQDAQSVVNLRGANWRGNDVREGYVLPAIIVSTHGDGPDAYVNLKVFMDGTDCYWVTSVKVGTGPRTYAWPVRA